jgi:hypothetical protein
VNTDRGETVEDRSGVGLVISRRRLNSVRRLVLNQVEEIGTVRNLLVFVLFVAVAIGAVGYWRGWFIVTSDPAKYTQDKDALRASVSEKSKALKDRVAGLWKKSEGLTGDEKASAQKELDELNKKHDRLEQQIKDLDDAGQDRFESAKKDLTKSLEDVEKKIEELTKKLETRKHA